MSKYEKWLGAGLGLIVTGNPIGGLLGFIAGTLVEQNDANKGKSKPVEVSEFEMNLIILATHLMRIDGHATINEISFTETFMNAHFDAKFAAQRTQILHHCLQKEYDLNVACTQLRHHTQQGTRMQIIHFLFDLALSDGALNERERFFIFKIAGFLSINDVEFRKISKEHLQPILSAYEILGVRKEMSLGEIRTAYRKLVLKYHPDRNKTASEAERKNLSLKFQQLKEAFEQVKLEKGLQ